MLIFVLISLALILLLRILSSRTHKVGEKIGLPVLKNVEVLGRIKSLIISQNQELELIYEKPVISNRIPKLEVFDARIHPERMPDNFHSKMNEFLNNRTKKCSSEDSSKSSFTFCELFAGIGGFGVALEALG